MTLRVGLTGGIASGKTLIANLFAEKGVAVHDTDVIARELVEPGTAALQQIVTAFGSEVLDTSGRLDRQAMRALVFSDAAKRKQLEAILHPAIRRELMLRAENSHGPYQLFVVPLLIESGMDKATDRVLVVDCPTAVQIQRLIARDGETEAGARRILAAQAPREMRIARADDLLVNTGTRRHAHAQVTLLHSLFVWLDRRS